jgi:hypothetical protein
MATEPGHKLWTAVDRRQITALIDKIVAAQLDLKPLCDPPGSIVRLKATPETTIAAACDILQSAIDDLRDVIRRLEDLPNK